MVGLLQSPNRITRNCYSPCSIVIAVFGLVSSANSTCQSPLRSSSKVNYRLFKDKRCSLGLIGVAFPLSIWCFINAVCNAARWFSVSPALSFSNYSQTACCVSLEKFFCRFTLCISLCANIMVAGDGVYDSPEFIQYISPNMNDSSIYLPDKLLVLQWLHQLK